MRLKHLFLGIILLTFLGCGNDSGLEGDNILHYDGANSTAPNLPAGFYVASARFNSTLLRNVEGKSIESVSIYMYEIPRDVRLTISEDETTDMPGVAIYEQDITSQLQSNGWNTVNLTSPFVIDGSPIWLGIELNISSLSQTIGCDAGPSNPNGDWLFDTADNEWKKFEDRVGDSINWNIRAILGE